MSRHVWESTFLTAPMVMAGQDAVKYAAARGADFDLACMFCGYLLETKRQQGWDRSTPHIVWNSAAKLHRYSKGNNAENYRNLGLRILCSMAREAGLSDHTPPQVVWDKLFAE
jgi:hypothetical protein